MRYAASFLFEQINKREDHANAKLISSLLYLGEKKVGDKAEEDSSKFLASLLARRLKVDIVQFDIHHRSSFRLLSNFRKQNVTSEGHMRP